MAKYVGRRLAVGMAKEATRGTAVAPTLWVPHTTLSFDEKVDKVNVSPSLGNIQIGEQAHNTKMYAQGTIEGPLMGVTSGLMFLNLLGTETFTINSPEASVGSHAFTIAETSNQHQSLTIGFDTGQTDPQDLNFPLAMINDFELVIEAGQLVTFSAEFRSLPPRWTSNTVSWSNENKFIAAHVETRVATTIGGLSGAAVLNPRRITLRVHKNVTDVDVIGTAVPEDIMNQGLSVEGEIEFNHEDNTWRNYMSDNSYRALEIDITDKSTFAAGTTNPELLIQLPRVNFSAWEPDYALDEIAGQTIQFTAFEDKANTQKMIHLWRLRNSRNSAY